MKNRIVYSIKREQVITGIERACRSELFKQQIIRLEKTGKLVNDDENVKQCIKTIVSLSDSSNDSAKSVHIQADSKSLRMWNELIECRACTPLHYERDADPKRSPYPDTRWLGQASDKRIDFNIFINPDIIIHCGRKSSPLPIQKYLKSQGHTVLILRKNTGDREKEKNILRCKVIIALINNDYDQHRPELILAYKNQVPIILMITDDCKEPLSDDYFLEFIFTQSSLLSNIIHMKDFDQAMDELTNVVKDPRAITWSSDPKKHAASRIENGPTTENLYDACRINDIERVRQYLRQMHVEDINRHASNGSTALHVASYNAHDEVLQLLLDAGASPAMRNRRFHLTAYEEASKASTKNLFHIHQHHHALPPFINDDLHIEWTCAYRDPFQKRQQLRQKLHQLLSAKDYDYDAMFAEIRKTMDVALDDSTLSPNEAEIVKKYFERLERELDPNHIIKCYSSTTSFHRYLNEYLAKNGLEFFDHELVNLNTDYRVTKSFLQLIAIVMYHGQFDELRFRGKTYRGLLMSDDDLHKYIVGSKIMNTSFLSTSKENDIARMFSGVEEAASLRKTPHGHSLQYNVMCVYNIKQRNTSLDIESISERKSDEKEVLILPFSAFEVKDVRKLSPNNVKIVLNELLHDGSDEFGTFYSS